MEREPPRLTVCGSLWEPGSVPPCCFGAMLKISELSPSRARLRDAFRGRAASMTGDKVQQNFYCGREAHPPQPFLSSGNGVSIQFVSVGSLGRRDRNLTRSFRLRYLVSKIGSNCGDHEFQCAGDHKCIPAGWRCNHLRECEDGSDEKGCEPSSERTGHRSGQVSSQQAGGSRAHGEIFANPYPVLGMGLGNLASGEYRISKFLQSVMVEQSNRVRLWDDRVGFNVTLLQRIPQ